ncbi:Uncharacterized protein FKW44_011063, partial [Caligus rogercresseyi]
RNDRYLSFGNVDPHHHKHPANVMSLGFVASNGKAMDLIWFLTSYRLTAADYIDIKTSGGNVVLQQDGAPARTVRATQAFLGKEMNFWAKD